jgi:acetyltransferase-like isoleucine patch superfamily enzyme
MQIVTETNFIEELSNHRWSPYFHVLTYADGGISTIPRGFLRNWVDTEAQGGTIHIGRCSALGMGSIAKYESDVQCLRIGRFVSGGMRLKFVLNGRHETRSISTSFFAFYGAAPKHPTQPQYSDSIIKNDVWIGDEVMMLGGGIVENGCVIGARSLLPPNFKSEPYGIYGGAPAKLIRFRFCEKIIEALLAIAWWEMPLSWIAANNDYFLLDLTKDVEHALERLKELRQLRDAASTQIGLN